MNRLPGKLPPKQRKRNQKEVRKGQHLSAKALQENENLTQEEWKKRHPHKPLSPQKRGELLAKTRTPSLAPQRSKKHSKRTSTQDGVHESAPAHIHPEGSFWQKVLTKQGALQRKLFGKASLKKK